MGLSAWVTPRPAREWWAASLSSGMLGRFRMRRPSLDGRRESLHPGASGATDGVVLNPPTFRLLFGVRMVCELSQTDLIGRPLHRRGQLRKCLLISTLRNIHELRHTLPEPLNLI